MWTAKVVETNFVNGSLFVTFEFFKGEKSFRETRMMNDFVDTTWLYNNARSRISQLEQLEAYQSKIVTGDLVLETADMQKIQSSVEAILNPTEAPVSPE